MSALGKRGGKALAEKRTPRQRKRAARKAARARWDRVREAERIRAEILAEVRGGFHSSR